MRLNLDSNFLLNLFLYVLLLGFGLFALHFEIKDLRAQKHLHGTEYEKGESAESIKEKISQAGKYQNNLIHWRRSYIVAALSSLLLLVLIKNQGPSGIELVSSFLLLYIIIYMTATIYKKWLSGSSSERIDELLSKL